MGDTYFPSLEENTIMNDNGIPYSCEVIYYDVWGNDYKHINTTPEKVYILADENDKESLKDKIRSALANEEETIKPDMVNKPPHYNREGAMETIEEMKLVFGIEATMHYCLLNAWKYRARALHKNGEEDLKKSDWYLREYRELSSIYLDNFMNKPIDEPKDPNYKTCAYCIHRKKDTYEEPCYRCDKNDSLFGDYFEHE